MSKYFLDYRPFSLDIPHILIPCYDHTNKGISDDVDDDKDRKHRYYNHLNWLRVHEYTPKVN